MLHCLFPAARYCTVWYTPGGITNKKSREMEYSSEPPGAARYGNFISYYNFHPPDERTKLLPVEILASICENVAHDQPIAILDVGCNSGELTERVHELIEEKLGRRCCTLAIDLDPILILRARENNNSKFNITYDVVDVSDVQFLAAAKRFLETIGRVKFDITFLFSITMWIHLNRGDEGLESSLSSVSTISKALVVEPQPWRCYRAAVRRMKRSGAPPFEMFDKLRSRSGVEDDIVVFLETRCHMRKVFETSRTSWGRKLIIFKEVLGDAVQRLPT
uniref:RNA methyltransferase n=4 Tax=Lygus hesperus TaxID=30085 RepID=A0A0A9Z113_LYGHE